MEGTKLIKLSILFIAFLFTSPSNGSVIKFQAYPNVLKANLTSSASMRCSLADTQPSSGQIGKRSVTSSSADVFHISSIFITNSNGGDVASVSPFDAPIAYVNPGNIEVKGDVSGTSSEGYIEITWKDPSVINAGEYNCEVNAVDHHHHPVVFDSTIDITRVTPTINDVITEMKNVNKKQETEINGLKQQQEKMKQCASKRVGFMAVVSKFYTIASGQPAIFDKVIYSNGGGYDSVTGVFTCTEPGLYSFRVHALSRHKDDVVLSLVLNNATVTSMYAYGPAHSDPGTVETAAAGALLQLNTDDAVHVVADNNPDDWAASSDFYQDGTVFQGNVFIGQLEQADCVFY